MNAARPAVAARQPTGLYFFLSYAHPAPTADRGPHDGTDPWVKKFYRDLSDEVARLARRRRQTEVGFLHELLPAGSDWNTMLTAALRRAEVFVALYSPHYVSWSWPRRELAAFRRRVEAVGSPERARRHILPVLWNPFPVEQHTPDVDDALAIGRSVPYFAEHGLRALCMLNSFQEQYMTIVKLVAARIVEVAHGSPLGPSPAPHEIAETPPVAEAQFLVAVSAPHRASRPPSREHLAPYGATSVLWRPFAEAEAPVAEYAATVAERLGLAAQIVDLATARPGVLDARPAVLLVDPWILDQKNGRAALRTRAKGLHKWVIPLIVVDRNDPQFADRGAILATEVADILRDAGARRVGQAHEVAEFVHLMPYLVTEARRQYLRNAPVFPPKGPHSGRPRLGGQDLSTFRRARDEDR